MEVCGIQEQKYFWTHWWVVRVCQHGLSQSSHLGYCMKARLDMSYSSTMLTRLGMHVCPRAPLSACLFCSSTPETIRTRKLKYQKKLWTNYINLGTGRNTNIHGHLASWLTVASKFVLGYKHWVDFFNLKCTRSFFFWTFFTQNRVFLYSDQLIHR
jgi:hypothetical protein